MLITEKTAVFTPIADRDHENGDHGEAGRLGEPAHARNASHAIVSSIQGMTDSATRAHASRADCRNADVPVAGLLPERGRAPAFASCFVGKVGFDLLGKVFVFPGSM